MYGGRLDLATIVFARGQIVIIGRQVVELLLGIGRASSWDTLLPGLARDGTLLVSMLKCDAILATLPTI